MSWGFDSEKLSEEKIAKLKDLAKLARGDILKMTSLAKSGHPGGSMSSIDIYLVLYSCANVDPAHPYWAERDRIVISHGHTSPGVYAALARVGFFEVDSVITRFRKAGTIFEGHVERGIPGVEWSSGNLGQGLSAGCGFALASKLHQRNYQVFVVMSDGEQAKGQVGEARRFAKKYSLNNLTVIIDYNRLQLSGPLDKIMPQNIKENYLADGWEILEADGHDYQQIYQAIRTGVKNTQSPIVIMANTLMGKGVSFMENKFEFHGMPLTSDECATALSELGLENDMERYLHLRNKILERKPEKKRPPEKIKIDSGQPRSYGPDEITDNRSAFGQALKDLGQLNSNRPGRSPLAVLDCDLVGSVKTQKFAQDHPDHFFQAGIQEHNTATVAGALSTQGIVTFFADFGVFGVDETYNQHRLNDLNQTNLKLVCTHNGIDVGQDGKTHQCIDYVGIINNLYGYKIIIPADPNQTDRVIRYIASQPGNFFVGVGRSKFRVILKEDGSPFFAGDYQFRYGKAEVIREGNQAAIITTGSMVHRAVQAWETLKKRDCQARIINVSCLSDLDERALTEAAGTGIVITYEDHNVKTGLGSLVANFLAENSLAPRFRKLGIIGYGGSGLSEDLFRMQGLDIESLVETVLGGR